MVTMDKDGIKMGGVYYPFTPFDNCDGCKYLKHMGEVEGVAINRDVCRMTPDDEDRFLFNDIPVEKLPPCMRE